MEIITFIFAGNPLILLKNAGEREYTVGKILQDK